MGHNISNLKEQIAAGQIEPAFLKEREVATYLQCSVNWLRKCRDSGVGPKWVKMGSMIRYPVDDLEQYLEASVKTFTGQSD